MEINKPTRIGLDDLAKGLVTNVFSKEAEIGATDVGFQELENLQPTQNRKLVTTQPFNSAGRDVVRLPSPVADSLAYLPEPTLFVWQPNGYTNLSGSIIRASLTGTTLATYPQFDAQVKWINKNRNRSDVYMLAGSGVYRYNPFNDDFELLNFPLRADYVKVAAYDDLVVATALTNPTFNVYVSTNNGGSSSLVLTSLLASGLARTVACEAYVNTYRGDLLACSSPSGFFVGFRVGFELGSSQEGLRTFRTFDSGATFDTASSFVTTTSVEYDAQYIEGDTIYANMTDYQINLSEDGATFRILRDFGLTNRFAQVVYGQVEIGPPQFAVRKSDGVAYFPSNNFNRYVLAIASGATGRFLPSQVSPFEFSEAAPMSAPFTIDNTFNMWTPAGVYTSQDLRTWSAKSLFTNIGALGVAVTELPVTSYSYRSPSGVYLATDAWDFKTGDTDNRIYEFSAFNETVARFEREKERLYYINSEPATLPMATFATQGDANIQKFMRAGTADGQAIYRHYRPTFTALTDTLFVSAADAALPLASGTVSETYYLPQQTLPETDFAAFRAASVGSIGAINYGYAQGAGGTNFIYRSVPFLITEIVSGVESGIGYYDFYVQTGRRNVMSQIPSPIGIVNPELSFASFQVFRTQYGYKTWYGTATEEQSVQFAASDYTYPFGNSQIYSVENGFIYDKARLYLQRPVTKDNAVWALPSTLTPRRTGGDSGSNYVSNRLYVDCAPSLVAYQSQPKNNYQMDVWSGYNNPTNTKDNYDALFSQTFTSADAPLSGLGLASGIGFPSWITLSSEVIDGGAFSSYVLTVASGVPTTFGNFPVSLVYTGSPAPPDTNATLNVYELSITETETLFSTLPSDLRRGHFAEQTDALWNRVEMETPDTTEAAQVIFTTQPFTAPKFDQEDDVAQTITFTLPYRRQEDRDSARLFFASWYFQRNTTGDITASTASGAIKIDVLNAGTNTTNVPAAQNALKTALDSAFGTLSTSVVIKLLPQYKQTINLRDEDIATSDPIRTLRCDDAEVKISFISPVAETDTLSARAIFDVQSSTVNTVLERYFLKPTTFPTQRKRVASATTDGVEAKYWNAGLTDVNAFYTVGVTAVYDGFEETDIIGTYSQAGVFDYEAVTRQFGSVYIEGKIKVNPALAGKRLSYFKIYVSKSPQQSTVEALNLSDRTVFISGAFERKGTDFDRNILNSMVWVAVVVVDEQYVGQFDRGIFVLESSISNVKTGNYFYAPKEAGQPLIVAGSALNDNEYSWLGGNFNTPQPDGGGSATVNLYYPNEQQMTPFIDGGWVSEAATAFEPAYVSTRFRITGNLFNKGVVQYRRTPSGVFTSYVLPNGAMTATLVTTSGQFFPVPDRLEYEAFPTGLGNAVNPNGTLSENIGRLSAPVQEILLQRDHLSAGLDATVAGRRYLFNLTDESGDIVVSDSQVIRSAVANGVPQFSFTDANLRTGLNVLEYETRLSGKIVAVSRNRYNDFSENLRLLLVQDVQSKILSVQGDGAPISIRELDGVSSPYRRSAIQTPYGICLISPQGLFLVNDDQVVNLSAPIDTVWKKEFNDTAFSTEGDYPKTALDAATPFVVQGFYDVESRQVYAMKNARAFVYDFEQKVWFTNQLGGFLEGSFIPARVIRDQREAFVAPAVNLDRSGIISILKRDIIYQLAPIDSSYEIDSTATTNVFVAPMGMEYQVLRVGVVLSGGLTSPEDLHECKVEIVEAALGANGNFSIDGGLVRNVYTFPISTSTQFEREFDVPVNVGKNLRAFAVRLTLTRLRVTVEEINITVVPRKRPISRGINPTI